MRIFPYGLLTHLLRAPLELWQKAVETFCFEKLVCEISQNGGLMFDSLTVISGQILQNIQILKKNPFKIAPEKDHLSRKFGAAAGSNRIQAKIHLTT